MRSLLRREEVENGEGAILWDIGEVDYRSSRDVFGVAGGGEWGVVC